MFDLPDLTLKQEVGEDGLDRLEMLCRWLFKGSVEKNHRIAPSLIIRGECELFGLSAPRFAVRRYVYTPDSTSPIAFFNIRRLKWFHETIRAAHPELSENRLNEKVLRGSPVADSLITPSVCSSPSVRLITCDLAAYFGKECAESSVVPFMQHMSLGGGMCAQACIFMALCLHERDAKAITGLGEMVAGELDSGEVELRGLDDKQIADILQSERFGLGACLEDKLIKAGTRESISNEVKAAWRGYVNSRIPCICLVDIEKMQLPDGIYAANNIPTRRKGGGRPRKHAILLVGCHRIAGSCESRQFVFNDPATYPFLTASYSAMLDARAKEGAIQWISVLPNPATLPLVGRHDQLQEGVFFHASVHQRFTPWYRFQAEGHWPGEWKLARASEDGWGAALGEMFAESPDGVALRSSLANHLNGDQAVANRTLWIQWLKRMGKDHPDEVWLWPGERPDDNRNGKLMPVARFRMAGGSLARI